MSRSHNSSNSMTPLPGARQLTEGNLRDLQQQMNQEPGSHPELTPPPHGMQRARAPVPFLFTEPPSETEEVLDGLPPFEEPAPAPEGSMPLGNPWATAEGPTPLEDSVVAPGEPTDQLNAGNALNEIMNMTEIIPYNEANMAETNNSSSSNAATGNSSRPSNSKKSQGSRESRYRWKM